MGVDVLRGRFVAVDDSGSEKKYNPVAIISSSNTWCGFGRNQHQCRDFFSETEYCPYSDGELYVDKETAERCLKWKHKKLQTKDGQVSDSYKKFPKTDWGYVRGFFQNEFDKETYDEYKKQEIEGREGAYRFEQSKLGK